MARRRSKFIEGTILQNVAILALFGFAWAKMGLGAAVKDIGVPQIFPREYPPQTETGYMTQAAWQEKYGGSYLDYQDWLKGQ